MVHSDNHNQSVVHWRCPACGIRARVPAGADRIVCLCDYEQLGGVTPGLGDWIAAGLHRIGVTRYRYQLLKKRLGLKPTCKCPQRQQSLNAIGRLASRLARKLFQPVNRVVSAIANLFDHSR